MRRITILALGVLSLFSCSNPINEIEMQLVEGGNFLMGSDAQSFGNEAKIHIPVLSGTTSLLFLVPW